MTAPVGFEVASVVTRGWGGGRKRARCAIGAISTPYRYTWDTDCSRHRIITRVVILGHDILRPINNATQKRSGAAPSGDRALLLQRQEAAREMDH